MSGKNIFCSINNYIEFWTLLTTHLPLVSKRRLFTPWILALKWHRQNMSLEKIYFALWIRRELGKIEFWNCTLSFFSWFCMHSQSKIYFFQRHVLPIPFQSQNSRCRHCIRRRHCAVWWHHEAAYYYPSKAIDICPSARRRSITFMLDLLNIHVHRTTKMYLFSWHPITFC